MSTLSGPRSHAKLLVPIAALLAAAALAAAGTPSLKAYFASDFKDQAYQQKTYSKVAGSWKMPGDLPKTGSKVVVIAVILKDGALGDTKVHLESGSKAWDDAGVAAIKKAAPFGPLPDSYPQPSVEVHFHFEYGP